MLLSSMRTLGQLCKQHHSDPRKGEMIDKPQKIYKNQMTQVPPKHWQCSNIAKKNVIGKNTSTHEDKRVSHSKARIHVHFFLGGGSIGGKMSLFW